MSFWGGKSAEEWEEIWRQERLREDEMLAFYEAGTRLTNKALAAKFNLRPGRVGILIRRRVDFLERERMHGEIKLRRVEGSGG